MNHAERLLDIYHRALDMLGVEIRNGSEVWVRFQNFEAGKAKKVPQA